MVMGGTPFIARSSKQDSPPISKRIAAARSVALALKADVSDMIATAGTKRNGGASLARTKKVLGDIDTANETANELQEIETIASPAQAAVIRRIAPLLRELAHNTESMLEHLKPGTKQGSTDVHLEYLKAHEQIANHLASLIVEAIDNPGHGELRPPAE
jgi:hypothetical protein